MWSKKICTSLAKNCSNRCLLQDLISLVKGDQPSWLIGINEITGTFGLELLEMILSTYPAVFFSVNKIQRVMSS